VRSCHIEHFVCSTRDIVAELYIQNIWYVTAFQSLLVTQPFETTFQFSIQVSNRQATHAAFGIAMIV